MRNEEGLPLIPYVVRLNTKLLSVRFTYINGAWTLYGLSYQYVAARSETFGRLWSDMPACQSPAGIR